MDDLVCIRSFSLPEFVAEVQEAIKPVLNAYLKVSAELTWEYLNMFPVDSIFFNLLSSSYSFWDKICFPFLTILSYISF